MPTANFVLVTVTEAQAALNVSSPDFIYRLLRAGVLNGEKIGRVWVVDDESVAARRRAVEAKRSSKSNRAAVLERRKAEGRARYAQVFA